MYRGWDSPMATWTTWRKHRRRKGVPATGESRRRRYIVILLEKESSFAYTWFTMLQKQAIIRMKEHTQACTHTQTYAQTYWFFFFAWKQLCLLIKWNFFKALWIAAEITGICSCIARPISLEMVLKELMNEFTGILLLALAPKAGVMGLRFSFMLQMSGSI